YRQRPRVGLQFGGVSSEKMPRQANRNGVCLQRPQGTGLIEMAEEADPVILAQVPGKETTISRHFKLALEVDLKVIKRGILEQWPLRLIGHVHHTGFLRVLRNRAAGEHQDAPQATALYIQPLPSDGAPFKQN